MALRPFAGRKEGHVVKAIARERDAHMSYALGVTAQLESQERRAIADKLAATNMEMEERLEVDDLLGWAKVTAPVAGSDQHAHDIQTAVARILVGLPFALARLMEATSRRLTSKGTGGRVANPS